MSERNRLKRLGQSWDWALWALLSVAGWWFDPVWYIAGLAGWLLGAEARAVIVGGTFSRWVGIAIAEDWIRWLAGVHYAFLASVKLHPLAGAVILALLPIHWVMMRRSAKGDGTQG